MLTRLLALFCVSMQLLACSEAPGSQDESQDECGNGLVADSEQCDGDDLGHMSCALLGQGFGGGTLTCALDCTFDTSGCLLELCSNGMDDDGDGVADCADADCDAAPECASVCGDSVCERDEDTTNCPQDCVPQPFCGDDVCEGSEDLVTCPADCDIGQPCDVVGGLGCEPDMACYLADFDGNVECLLAGSTPLGEPCVGHYDCGAGALCLSEGPGETLCTQLCRDTDDCDSGECHSLAVYPGAWWSDVSYCL